MPGTGHRRVGERREVRGEERCGGSLLFVESGGGEAGGETLGTGVGRRATELLPVTRERDESKRSATRFKQKTERQERRQKRGKKERVTHSIRRRALYFATRSERAGAPVLIWPVRRATTRSAMTVFSVSPERWEIMTPQPSD